MFITRYCVLLSFSAPPDFHLKILKKKLNNESQGLKDNKENNKSDSEVKNKETKTVKSNKETETEKFKLEAEHKMSPADDHCRMGKVILYRMFNF